MEREDLIPFWKFWTVKNIIITDASEFKSLVIVDFFNMTELGPRIKIKKPSNQEKNSKIYFVVS